MMTRDLTSIVASMMQAFRTTGRLSQGERTALAPEDSCLALQQVQDTFVRTVGADNRQSDLDLRPDHLVDSRTMEIASWEGDLQQGLLERQRLTQPLQFSEITRCRNHNVSRLRVQWNREQAQFEAVSLDRLDSRRSYQQHYALFEAPTR